MADGLPNDDDDDNLLIYINPLGAINHIAICVFYQPSRSSWQLSHYIIQTPSPHAHSIPNTIYKTDIDETEVHFFVPHVC